ncbi:unnamed protein product [Linum trigynum]|uniref:CCHC-type domain-containing protein n=1 Tax=Linum trigynum TaxID=586398 RepID=A0AAV2GSY1_9ROSI
MARITNDQVVEFSLEEVQATRVHKSRMLIGRLFSDDRLSTAELRDAVNRPWQGQDRIMVRELPHGLFEFTLPSEAAKSWVLQRTPWTIADRILHLKPWIPAVSQRTFEELAIVPFRVQLWEIQEGCCTPQFGRKIITSMIGRILEAAVFTSADNTRNFVKVKTLVDFSKPLRSQIMATNDETGGFWIRLTYEFLPCFCFKCGRVGHARQTCCFDPPTRKERFGPHMSTKEMGRKVFDGDETRVQAARIPRSVWVNTELHRPQSPGADRDLGPQNPVTNRPPKKTGTDAALGQKRAGQVRQQARGPEDGSESPLWMGSSTNPFITTEDRPLRSSPKKFPVAKGPRLALGNLTRRGKPKKKQRSPMDIDGPVKPLLRAGQPKGVRAGTGADPGGKTKAGRGPAPCEPASSPAPRQPVDPKPKKAEGKSRPRRLILEEES